MQTVSSNKIIRADFTAVTESPTSLVRQAKQLLTLARKQANSIVKQARIRAARHVYRAYCRSKIKGFRQGMRKAELERLAYHQKAQALYDKAMSSARDECVALALSVAEQIIQTEIRYKRKGLAKRIEKALSTLTSMRQIRIETNPNDFESVLAELNAGVKEGVNLQTSSSVSQGNARIETIAGVVELNWRENLREIKTCLESKIEPPESCYDQSKAL